MLGEVSDPQELFLINECEDSLLSAVGCKASVTCLETPANWAELGGSSLTDLLINVGKDDGKTFFYQKRYMKQKIFPRFCIGSGLLKWISFKADVSTQLCSPLSYLQTTQSWIDSEVNSIFIKKCNCNFGVQYNTVLSRTVKTSYILVVLCTCGLRVLSS